MLKGESMANSRIEDQSVVKVFSDVEFPLTEQFGAKLPARNSNSDRHKGVTSGSVTMTKQESQEAAVTFYFSAE